jgi:cellulose synthase/poly-beta-1,6-N-acetylglucosamine synthase-like glycosyltransferase
VVVCAFSAERLDDLTRCLDSVARQSRPADEIIVVIDHNPELLAHVLATTGDRAMKVIPSSGQRGLSTARNTGVSAATSDVVVFLDDDALPEVEWLAELLRPFHDPEVVAVGGRIDPAWPTERPWWFPHHLDWTIGCSIPSMPPAGGPIRNVFGASAAFRREALHIVGGFNPKLGRVGKNGAGCEETDVCIRLRQHDAGALILYAPRAVVRHRVTDDRATVRHVLRRCLAEGRSKALLSKRVGGAATRAERTYALMVARQFMRDALGGFRHPRRFGQAAVLICGWGCATAGYARGRCTPSK